jgi:signal transduction histidine kinase
MNVTSVVYQGKPLIMWIFSDITGRKRAEWELRDLSSRLLEVQETERRNLSRELHDEVGQMLTGLKIMLEMAEQLPKDQVQAGLGDAKALVDDLVTQVRGLSLRLRPSLLDDLGLLPALLWYVKRYTTQTRIQVAFEHGGLEKRRFAGPVETAVYRIVQEALTNVARHAEVDKVTVRLWTGSSWIHLCVEDQGKGFDPKSDEGRSSGLVGMRERASLLDGRLTILSAPGSGTRIEARLPLGERTQTDMKER